jgi:Family of unknown function (DUF5990)
MRPEKFELPLRIVMEDPVADVTIAMQRGASGKVELIGPVRASPKALVFDFAVTVSGAGADGGLRLLGPFVQGPPNGRFVYLNVGAYAGQQGAQWNGRTKVPLAGLTWSLIEALPSGGRLEAHILGKGRGGGPAFASVAILPPGWRACRN